jgi:hypothetical protein
MTTPQCHFLPSTEDADALSKAAVHYTMEFLVEEFQGLKGLKSFVPPIQSLHPVSKSTAAPMAILLKDEKYKKYKDKTIEIMQALMEDTKLSGTLQVCNSRVCLPACVRSNLVKIPLTITVNMCVARFSRG